ncbi:MAG: DUF1385 domain-containing protein [Actinomycetota bacterium]|jgi:uncharacterized protein YqhQ|nr:DUF1385 domain-containing protein [Actinomycetota bacterium]
MAEDAPATKNHLYGGQAVIEGVMMRGAGHWAVAVRRPSGQIHLESHRIDSVVKRWPILGKPFLRGIIVLGQSMVIGMKALQVGARESSGDDEQLSSGQMGASLAIAMTLFIVIFILGPTVLFSWVQHRVGSDGILTNVLEGLFRVGIFVAYLFLIGRTKEIHRVFEYHGAEHKTIAAFEHDDPLDPEHVDRYSTVHLRCGTNFLIIVMIITVFVFTLFGTPGILWRIGSRLIAIPAIAGLSYEALRLGARYPDSAPMRLLMAPGKWLQRITTQPPDRGQIEVAIASFNEVLRAEREGASHAETP